MNRGWSWAMLSATLIAAGCGTLRDAQTDASQPPPAAPVAALFPANDNESLLRYFGRVRKLPAAALAKELDEARQQYTNTGSELTRVRYAIVLSVPGMSFSDDARALEMIDPLLRNPGAKLHPVAFIVGTQIQEQRRAQTLQRRVDEEQRRGQTLQQRLDEEQRRGQTLQQKYDEEQKRVQGLQQKLDALRSLEKSLLEREQGAGRRR